jgi:acetaldehyde dehydrogenase
METIKVAVIGSGKIGVDLCERLMITPGMELVALIGRNERSEGLERFKRRIPYVVDSGLNSFYNLGVQVDGFFDATSAQAHLENSRLIATSGHWVIDLTPSNLGKPFVPILSNKVPYFAEAIKSSRNFSMVSCGGQSCAPLIFSIAKGVSSIEEIEVSSSIAALSAGLATRLNVDNYCTTTENLVSIISGCVQSKVILVINPSDPPVMMRTTVHVKGNVDDLEIINRELQLCIEDINRYVPGYELTVPPHLTGDGLVSATVKVTGIGLSLPTYAGNLDIINAAAIRTAFIASEANP